MDEPNGFFVGVGENCITASEYLQTYNLTQCTYSDNDFHWKYVDPNNIHKTISQIKTGGAGSDGISLKILKLTLPYILPTLEHIFNFSFQYGTFPLMWKSAIVCPIPKTKNPTEISHYRPIAILPIISKIIEKIAGRQIQDYLCESNLHDPHQFAYRRGGSAQTCLLRVLDGIRRAADEKMITLAVFFDLSKAFDRVQHHISTYQ